MPAAQPRLSRLSRAISSLWGAPEKPRPPAARRMRFEPLEPRLLLSADFLPEAAEAMADGLDLLGSRLDSFLSGDAAFAQHVPLLLDTPMGWALIAVGSLTGGLFAAFSFAISVFAIPRLLDEPVDALTAMGQSMALVWNNLPVMLVWAMIVVGLFALSVATGLVGLVVVFPVLGHATWHAYSTMWRARGAGARLADEGQAAGALS